MGSWLDARNLILIASLLLNALLAASLFFRSALNQIVVNWYTGRRQRRDEERRILFELNQRMDSFATDYFAILVWGGVVSSARSQGEAETALQQQREWGVRVAEARQFLARHELELPPSIRVLVENLRRGMEIPDVDQLYNAQAIIRRSEAVSNATAAIRAEIARLLG